MKTFSQDLRAKICCLRRVPDLNTYCGYCFPTENTDVIKLTLRSEFANIPNLRIRRDLRQRSLFPAGKRGESLRALAAESRRCRSITYREREKQSANARSGSPDREIKKYGHVNLRARVGNCLISSYTAFKFKRNVCALLSTQSSLPGATESRYRS